MNTKLSRLQRAFQDSMLSGINAADWTGEIDASDNARRLSIYATAYRLRLRDALAHNFPTLQAYLGTEPFTAVADAYLERHPSTQVSVRAFGAQLAEWLRAHHPQEPWLAEFAQLEWALDDAFDAADEDALGIEALARIEPSQWPHLTFRFARSVQRLISHTNAAQLYEGVARQGSTIKGCLAPAVDWLIWRRALSAQYRSMSKLEACAFDGLRAGRSFGETCELMFELDAVASVPIEAAAILKRWITDGLVVGTAIVG